MNCPKCGNTINEGELFCPECGAKIGEQVENAQSAAAEAAESLSSPAQNAENEAAAPGKEENGSSAAQSAEDLPSPGTEENEPSDAEKAEEKQPKKKLKIKWIVIAAAVIALLIAGILAAINWAKISNWFGYTFKSDADYYHGVESGDAERLSQNLSTIYDKNIRAGADAMSDGKLEAELKITVSDSFKSMLKSLLSLVGSGQDLSNVDISWLNDLSLKCSANQKNDLSSSLLSLSLNSREVASASLFVDKKDDKLAVKVPLISDSYYDIPVQTLAALGPGAGGSGVQLDLTRIFRLLGLDSENPISALNTIAAARPSGEEIEKLINRYFLLVTDMISDVTVEKADLTVGEVTQKVYSAQTKISGEKLYEIVVKLLETAREDAEIKTIVDRYESAVKGTSGTLYGEFGEMIEKALKNVRESSEGEKIRALSQVRTEIYIDDTGKIKGRKIVLPAELFKNGKNDPDGGKEATVYYALAEDGGKFAFEAAVEFVGKSAICTADGEVSGSKYTGSAKLKYNGMKLLTLSFRDLDKEELKKGKLSGRISMKFEDLIQTVTTVSSFFGKKLDTAVTAVLTMLGSGLEIYAEGSGNVSQAEAALGVSKKKDDGKTEDLLTIRMKSGITTAEEVTGVSGAQEYKDLQKDLGNTDELLGRLIDNLKAAGVPQELLDMIPKGRQS